MIYLILLNVAGILITVGFGSIVYLILTRQVTPRRRPVYFLAAALSGQLVIIYLDFLVGRMLEFEIIPDGQSRWIFLFVYIVLGCLLTLVPQVDRKEFQELYTPTLALGEKLDHVVGPEVEEENGRD